PLAERVASIDSSLSEASQNMHNATLELEEVAYQFEKAAGCCENQPERTAEINERLTLLNRLKRKYGATVAEMRQYQKQTESLPAELEKADERIEALKEQLQKHTEACNQMACLLSEKRKEAALALSKELTPLLQALNMPKAQFSVAIAPQVRNRQGDD